MIRKIICVLCLCIFILPSRGQQKECHYASPFDFPLLLSANFGELRPNHFHNGLDIKTQGVTGKPVKAIADGYVSRVLVQHGGYGQAVYVAHPDGRTSVYGHVEYFAAGLQKRVRAYQYEYETFLCDLHFGPEEFPVKQGQVIALSGNEGASAGPHLHLELRDSKTGDYIDPMPFYRGALKDGRSPVASWVAVYPVPGKGMVDSSACRKLLNVQKTTKAVEAWGKIYTGISAKDYMDGTSNFYGVHSVKLFVDDKEVFSSCTDKVLAGENRMINSFIDFQELMRSRRLIMRSFKAPGNQLELIRTSDNRGVIDICEKRDYHFRYELKDNFGNKSVCRFIVKGVPQEIVPVDEEGTLLRWNRMNVVQQPGMHLIIPRGMLYEDVYLKKDISGDSSGVSFDYILDAGNVPLHSYCTLALGVRRYPVADSTKYYMVQKQGSKCTPVGGKMENGWLKASIRSLGTFAVEVDTLAPRIVPQGKVNWRKNPRSIRLKVSDSGSGISSYKVRIDGKFVLFGLKRGALVLVDSARIVAGKPHTMEVQVIDQCGNIAKENIRF